MPTWNVKGQQIFTADIGGQSIFQKFRVTQHDQLLLSVRTWIMFHNNPSFTNFYFEIWSDNGGVPGMKLHTSDARTKAELLSSNSGPKEGYWDFNAHYGVAIKKNVWYHLVPNSTGYTGSESSHVAWMIGWPDPVYDTNFTLTFENLSVAPYAATLIGARYR